MYAHLPEGSRRSGNLTIRTSKQKAVCELLWITEFRCCVTE